MKTPLGNKTITPTLAPQTDKERREMLDEFDFLVSCADKIDRPHSFVVNKIRTVLNATQPRFPTPEARKGLVEHFERLAMDETKNVITCPVCRKIRDLITGNY